MHVLGFAYVLLVWWGAAADIPGIAVQQCSACARLQDIVEIRTHRDIVHQESDMRYGVL